MTSLWKQTKFLCSQLDVIAHRITRYTYYLRGTQSKLLAYMGTYQRIVQRSIHGNSVVTHRAFVRMPDDTSTTRHGDAYDACAVTRYVTMPMAKGIAIGK